MRLSDFADLSQQCRQGAYGFDQFRQDRAVVELRWPADVLEQWLYDHAGNLSFLQDYGDVDLSQVAWEVEALTAGTFMEISTGPSDGDIIEQFAADPDHWVAVRNQGVHLGVGLSWEIHGTWKRWPLVLDRTLINPETEGLQLIEGRTRVGVLRGRRRLGKFVADKHLAWVGRPR